MNRTRKLFNPIHIIIRLDDFFLIKILQYMLYFLLACSTLVDRFKLKRTFRVIVTRTRIKDNEITIRQIFNYKSRI